MTLETVGKETLKLRVWRWIFDQGKWINNSANYMKQAN